MSCLAAPRWASLMPPSPVFSAIPDIDEAMADGLLGRARQRPVAHGRDHQGHGEVEGLGAVLAADEGVHVDLGDDVGIRTGAGEV